MEAKDFLQYKEKTGKNFIENGIINRHALNFIVTKRIELVDKLVSVARDLNKIQIDFYNVYEEQYQDNGNTFYTDICSVLVFYKELSDKVEEELKKVS